VRLIKPNLIASHDWHVQPICQRSLRLVRLSGALGSRPRRRRRSILELLRWAFRFCEASQPFWRELFKTIELSLIGQAHSRSAESQISTGATNARAAEAHGKNFPGLAMACFVWGPLCGASSGALPDLAGCSQTTHRTSFPFLCRGSPLATGSSTALFQLSESSTG